MTKSETHGDPDPELAHLFRNRVLTDSELGEQTVRIYCKILMKNLGVTNAAGLTQMALSAGLTQWKPDVGLTERIPHSSQVRVA
jgi:hypothetical protein